MSRQAAPSSISITAKPKQTKVLTSPKRFKLLVAGRRFGKTIASIIYLLEGAAKPGAVCWYVSPTYKQSKMIAWRKLKEFVPKHARLSCNETELTIELINGSIISLKGADKEDSLRGAGLDRCVFDEFAIIKPDAWFEVIRPALADKEGSALFIGTPDGMQGLAYDLWNAAPNKPNWGRWQYTTLQGGNVSETELQEIAAELDERTYKQEILALFEPRSDRIYYCYDERLNGSDDVVTDNDHLHIGMDFNIGRMAAIVHVIRNNEPRAVDELVGLRDTRTMIAAIKQRYPLQAQLGWITVYPDASGQNDHTSAAETDLEQLKMAGFALSVGSTNPFVKDRINAMNAAFLNVRGQRRYKVNAAKCPSYVQSLNFQGYADDGKPDKSTGLDHCADAGGYCLVRLMPLLSNPRLFR